MERRAWLRRVRRARCHPKAPAVGRRKPTRRGPTITNPWREYGFKRREISPSAGDVGRAVQAAARHNPFHPVRDYFESLVWDGVPRLETWLLTYFHVEDSEYVRAIGPRYLISAVARIFQPGCKVDHVLVLEGPQGKQKSEALRTLAKNDSWFTDRLSHVASKDAVLEIAGVLIVEIAEMDALTKATSSAIKSFLTRRRDRFRPPYRQAHNQPAAAMCVCRHHQPDRRRLSEGPDRRAAVLAGRLPRHDRPRWLGKGARPALGRGGASIQDGRALVARDAGTRSTRDRRANCAFRH